MTEMQLIVFSLTKARSVSVKGLFAVGVEVGDAVLATTYWPAEAISQAAAEARVNVIFQDQQIFDLVTSGLTNKDLLLKLSNIKIIKK